MLENIELKNYKSYDENEIAFKPITIFCGGNSSGKTSIIKSILLLKQSFEAMGNNYLLLNGNYTNNGSFRYVKHNDLELVNLDDMKISVIFSIMSNSPVFKEICRSFGMLNRRSEFSQFKIKAEFVFQENKDLPQVATIKSANITLITIHSNKNNRYGETESSTITMTIANEIEQRYNIQLINFPTPLYGLDQYPFTYENYTWNDCFCYFRGMQLVSLYKINLSKKSTSTLPVLYTIFRVLAMEFNKFEYIGPLREAPSRQYLAQDVYYNIGIRGENTAQYLAQLWNTEIYAPLPNDSKIMKVKLQDAVSKWSEKLGVGTVRTEDSPVSGIKVVQLLVGDQNIADVGFGVSQVLPILVQGMAMSEGETLILEQPEIHLHPKMQMDIADFLIAIAKQGKHLIIETHSDHIINRMVRRAVESKELREKLGIYFIDKNEKNCSALTKVDIDEEIGIDEAPQGFFDQYASESELILNAGYTNMMKSKEKS